MRKYIRGIICVSYSLIKFIGIRMFHMNGFKFTMINIVSPFTDIELGKKSLLELGKMVRMRSGSKIKIRDNSEVKIGENTSLNHGCMVISHNKITIGKNVQIGPNVLIYDHDHNFRIENGLKNLIYRTAPVEIGDDVWIGANTVILKGTKIGKNCVIGAGSVVNGCYADNTLIIQKRETTEFEIVGEK